MARKLTYNINRFDGGMTDDLRESDLSKCAFVSHFDIYCDAHRLVPMPGFVSDEAITGDADGLKAYDIRAFFYDGTMRAVGTKSDGTGSKLWEKATPTTSEWTATTSGEGADDLSTYTNLFSNDSVVWFVTNASSNTYLSQWSSGIGVTDKVATLQAFETTIPHVAEPSFDGEYHGNTGSQDIFKVDNLTVTDPEKTTAARIVDIQNGDETVGLLGYTTTSPTEMRLLIWDSESALIDQNVSFGRGRQGAIGYPSGVWVAAVDENLVDESTWNEEANGQTGMSIKYATVGGARRIITIPSATTTNGKILPTRTKYRDAMTFYARVPQDATPTTYKEGIWAVGRCKDQSPLAVSLLIDTTELSEVIGYNSFGSHHFFAHNTDGSVSRLDNFSSGTYDVTAVYESLMFGHETPNIKKLNGIAVTTEDLPSGASVVVKYRKDTDDSWTTMGTSDTTGNEQHTFTRAAGSPVGGFQEIQFRVEVTGKAAVKGLYISLTDTDDIPFNF